MKVIWTTNMLICGIAEELNGISGGFGGWMEQAFKETAECTDVDLVIVTSSGNTQLIKRTIGGVTYYVLPCGDAYGKFRASDKKAQALLKKIVAEEKPDLIHIWGTESGLGLALSRVAPEIPKVVYLQGIMKSVEKHYYESTSIKELKRNLTFYDFVKGRSVRHKNRELRIKADNEAEILQLSGHIICDNDWCIAMCRSMNPALTVHRQNLPIDTVFRETPWQNNDGHIIFCASQYAPFKGFETLLRALITVKRHYPDVCLEVPGGWQPRPETVRGKLTYNTYSRTINNLIKKWGVGDSIRNLGALSRRQMAEHMQSAEVFVQCSTVENHSSTMREAMNVGMPCVVSNAGSAAEYIRHGDTGFLYRGDESEVLAYYIIMLFRDEELRSRLGKAGRSYISDKYEHNESKSTIEIYKEIINDE
ncbi:MAG: glycosyltransferase family 4 protein [Clostridia bacterium]|nr:glycosyltransferase family 4 protein [Clostridia bacterium]